MQVVAQACTGRAARRAGTVTLQGAARPVHACATTHTLCAPPAGLFMTMQRGAGGSCRRARRDRRGLTTSRTYWPHGARHGVP